MLDCRKSVKILVSKVQYLELEQENPVPYHCGYVFKIITNYQCFKHIIPPVFISVHSSLRKLNRSKNTCYLCSKTSLSFKRIQFYLPQFWFFLLIQFFRIKWSAPFNWLPFSENYQNLAIRKSILLWGTF